MALIAQFICISCRQERYEVVTRSHVCADCRGTAAKSDEAAHMAKLVVLPIEERIRRIELQLYHLSTDPNALGSGYSKYVH